MNKGTLFLLFSVVLLGGGVAVGAFFEGRTQDLVPAPQNQEFAESAPKEERIPFTLWIEGVEYGTDIAPASSVYEAMMLLQETSDLSFKGIEFPGLGFFVEEINGLKQSQRAGKYWVYSVNGERAKVGVSQYVLKPHDIITWNYEQDNNL